MNGVAVGAGVWVAARVGVPIGAGGVCDGVAVTTTTRTRGVAFGVDVGTGTCSPAHAMQIPPMQQIIKQAIILESSIFV